jgi:hypothetical protein
MPLPANVTTVTVLGTFLTPEGDPSTGTITFTPSSWLTNSGANVAIPNSPTTKTLGTAGNFSVLLPITDDADLSPSGWVYNVSEVVDGVSQNYNILLPGTVAVGGTVYLADLVPAAPAGPEYYSLASSLTIGTVTTVATGGSATASITGLAPSQVLDLGIPTGATGTVASAGSGSVGTAAVAPTGDPDTGIYFPAANQVAVTTGGTQALLLAAGAVSSPTFSGTVTVSGVLSTPAGAVDQALQFAADGSVLQNLPARIPAAEQLLKQAVWWIDSAHSSASGQAVTNLGWGGTALNAQLGSAGSADSNDPRYLDWDGENYVYLPGVSSNGLTVPDSDALDLTGDLDLRARVAADDWTPAAQAWFVSKWGAAGVTRQSYGLVLHTTGALRLYWTTDGDTDIFITSTVATGVSDGAVKWVRATLDVDNGASGHDVAFYLSDDGVTWTQLGTTVTTAGVTSVYSGAEDVRVGAANLGSTFLTGRAFRAQILNGIGGTPVLDVDTSLVGSGAATSFTARTGQTVTINRSTSGRKAVAVTHPLWLLGTDDYLEVADNALIDFGATDSFTVLAVVRQWNTPLSNGRVMSKDNQTAAGGGYRLQITDTRVPSLTVYDGVDAVAVNGAAVTAGQATIIAGVLDRAGANINIYGNATAATAVSASTIDDTSNALPLRVGSRASSVANNGEFEFIAAAVFRRALTSSELTTITSYYQGRVG